MNKEYHKNVRSSVKKHRVVKVSITATMLATFSRMTHKSTSALLWLSLPPSLNPQFEWPIPLVDQVVQSQQLRHRWRPPGAPSKVICWLDSRPGQPLTCVWDPVCPLTHARELIWGSRSSDPDTEATFRKKQSFRSVRKLVFTKKGEERMRCERTRIRHRGEAVDVPQTPVI